MGADTIGGKRIRKVIRRDHLERSADILEAIGAPDGFTATSLKSWLDSRPHHLPRPLRRGMRTTQVQALINKLHHIGRLERRLSDMTEGFNYRRPVLYYFKGSDNMKIWIKARKEELERVKSGQDPVLFRQVHDVILSDGQRTLHTKAMDIFRVGFMERDIMQDHNHPPEGWDPNLPIYGWKLLPTDIWEKGGYKDLAEEGPPAPERSPIDIMEMPEGLMSEIVKKMRSLEGLAIDPRVVIIPAERWTMDRIPIYIMGMEVVISSTARTVQVAGVPKRVMP